MKVFNEEPKAGARASGETVLVLDKAEGQRLLEMVRDASDANKKKTSWAAMTKELERRLCCF